MQRGVDSRLRLRREPLRPTRSSGSCTPCCNWHRPILRANVAVAVGHAIRRPSMWNAWLVVVSLGLVAGLVASRASTLYVQNRIIALEMRLRLAATLPPELRTRIPELRLKHLIGLRFAGDGELAGLVERCLRGELATADAIKREIRDWRPDFARA